MKNKKKKLIVILYTEEKTKLNYAMGMIATAAALERPTELFFTGKSVKSLIINNKNSNFNYKNSEELLLAIIDLNTKLTVCSGALSDNNIKEKDLRSDIIINVEGLTSEQFKEIEKFFQTMPKLSHTISVKNPKTGVLNTVTLEGLTSFFG